MCAMPSFASKPLPSDVKLRGGYYTPETIADFLARWVGAAGRRILEPSCGDGVILAALAERLGTGGGLTGVELTSDEAAKARRVSGATVVTADFFTWFDRTKYGTFDGVAGNPPYIRFGSWQEGSRLPAFQMMIDEGLRPTRLTNAWVPFVVASLLAVRRGGRVGLVLPAELLQVGYAASLRSYLVDTCSDVHVISFRLLVFPGIQQEVVLLLATRGDGPARIRTVEIDDADGLATVEPSGAGAVRAGLHEREKWTKYYLSAAQIELVRRLRGESALPPLRRWASVDVGVVTGRNAFFCMTAADARERGLLKVTVPLVARSSQLTGPRYTEDDLRRQELAHATTRLLRIDGGFPVGRGGPVGEYLAAGEAAGVPTGYKCRIRRDWWVVPSVWVPDGFMLRQISTHPRIVANQAGATSTDTVHRVRTRSDVNMEKLAVSAFNSVAFAVAETVGRSYGGGVLELEPSEAEELPVPDPDLVPDWVVERSDRLLRAGDIDAALDLVDRSILIDKVGFGEKDVAEARRVWVRLRDRRKGRTAVRKRVQPHVS
jgi:adenine-specific DNA methylase